MPIKYCLSPGFIIAEFSNMDDRFELTVLYKEKEIVFPVKLLNYGYSYKLEVEIDKTKVLFEPDEERNWRALISYEDMQANKHLQIDLLNAIALALDEAFK